MVLSRVNKKTNMYAAKRRKINWSQIIMSLIMLAFSACVLYPFFYALAYSLSDAQKAMVTNVILWPAGFTLDNFIRVLYTPSIYTAFLVSVYRTVGGMIYSVTITALASYAISKRALPGRRVLSILLIIPMYISGGLLPTYVLITKYLHLYNNLLVYILPNGFWAFNMLLMRTYFETIPASLEESAKLDGAGDLKIFIKIVLPLSMPIVAVIAMFSGVWQWNAWFDAVLYVSKIELKPVQSILQLMLNSSMANAIAQMQGKIVTMSISPESIRMAMLFVTTLPIIMIYPFFQKYFIKGIMLGAVKA